MKLKQTNIIVENISIEIQYKRIKNLYLRVLSPAGKVVIIAPYKADVEFIKKVAAEKIDWIRKKQKKILSRPPKPEPQKYKYTDGETHHFLGEPFTLRVFEQGTKLQLKCITGSVELYVPKNSEKWIREAMLDELYRDRLKQVLPVYISKWEKVMNVKVKEFGIKKMKTRWGTCNPKHQRIWLNLALAKKPAHLMEYILVHEMVHLLERGHGPVFKGWMDRFLPEWRKLEKEMRLEKV